MGNSFLWWMDFLRFGEGDLWPGRDVLLVGEERVDGGRGLEVGLRFRRLCG